MVSRFFCALLPQAFGHILRFDQFTAGLSDSSYSYTGLVTDLANLLSALALRQQVPFSYSDTASTWKFGA